MFRSPWKRAFTALLVVMACTLAVPAHAYTTAPTMDSASAMKLWIKAMQWFSDLWTAPATSTAPRGHGFKFGAGHSSDGVAKAKAQPSSF